MRQNEPDISKKQNASIYMAFIALILLSFAFRVYQLDAVPLRGDEAFSALYWAVLPLSDSLATIATIEPHPPLTYVIFSLWGQVMGIQSVFALRLLPALLNTLGAAAMMALGWRLHSPSAGLLAGLMWALHPFEWWHAQDFRNYAIWAGLSATSLWLAWRILSGSRRPLDWLAYTGFSLASALMFYNELFMIGAVCVYAVIMHWRERRFLAIWLAVQALIIAVTLGAFLALQGHLIGAGYGGTALGFDASLWVTWFVPVLSFGDPFLATNAWWLLLILYGVALALIWRVSSRRAIWLILLGILPVLVLGVVSLRLNIFLPRYVMSVIPIWILIWALALAILWRRGARWRIVAALCVLLWCIIALTSWHLQLTGVPKSPPWPHVMQYLAQYVHDDDLVVQTTSDAAFGYYYHQIYGITAVETALPTLDTQPPAEIIAALERYSADYRGLWLVAETNPAQMNAGVVRRWAYDHMQPVHEMTIDGVPLRYFRSWHVAETDITTAAPLATFGDVVQLLDVRVFAPDADGDVTVWLYWRPLKPTTTPHKVFAHAYRVDGAFNPATNSILWAQDDQLPQDGRLASDNWQPGIIYREVLSLPVASLPAGEYKIVTGWYDPLTNDRLLVTTAAGMASETGTQTLSIITIDP